MYDFTPRLIKNRKKTILIEIVLSILRVGLRVKTNTALRST